MIKYHVRVINRFIGLHCWPEAPEQVKFLRDLHRHEFYIRTEVEVEHHDREIEFFILKGNIDKIINEEFGEEQIKNLGRKSCEEIATIVHSRLNHHASCHGRSMKIEVLEDDENGAVVHFPTTE